MTFKVPEASFQKNFPPGGFGLCVAPGLHFVLPCHIFWPTSRTVALKGAVVGSVWENRSAST